MVVKKEMADQFEKLFKGIISQTREAVTPELVDMFWNMMDERTRQEADKSSVRGFLLTQIAKELMPHSHVTLVEVSLGAPPACPKKNILLN